jgi:hypothetical protein
MLQGSRRVSSPRPQSMPLPRAGRHLPAPPWPSLRTAWRTAKSLTAKALINVLQRRELFMSTRQSGSWLPVCHHELPSRCSVACSAPIGNTFAEDGSVHRSTTLYDAARRCTTLHSAVRRCTTLHDAVRRCTTLNPFEFLSSHSTLFQVARSRSGSVAGGM